MRTIPLVVVALFAAGCPGGPGGSVPLDQYSDQAYRAVCSLYVRCGLMRSEAACNAVFQSSLSTYDLGDVYGDLVASGKVKYDGAQARRCLDSYASIPCSSAPSDDCLGIFEGLVPVGGDCESSIDCTPAGYCSYPANSTCPGACVARVPEGGAASSVVECMERLVLIDGKCAQPRQAGEICSLYECASGLLCSDHSCKAAAAEGEACTSSTVCGGGFSFLSCVGGTCRAPGAIGQSCATGASLACQLDLFCDTTSSLCQERVGEGQACDSISRPCGLGLSCSQDGKTCVKPAPAGQSCGSVTCDNGAYCETGTSICKARVAVGQPCPQSDACANYGACSKGTCKSLFSCP